MIFTRYPVRFSLPSPALFQRLIQSAFLIFCLYSGWRFHGFVLWMTGQSEIQVPRPPSVEAFLPIAALMGLRRLIESGLWDVVHPAGLAIFLAALGMALLLRKGFCGYICPVGLVSGLLNRLGRALKLSRVPGRGIDILLSAPKYVLLAFFLYTVFVGMDLRAVEQFASSPYNFVVDARMLGFFLEPSALTLMILAGLAALGVFLRSAWCRYLCPYGALLGLLSWIGPVRIRRDKDACVQCGRCSASCPGGIAVHLKADVRSPECVGCMRCQSVCPVPGCVTLRAGGREVPFWSIGFGCVLLLLAAWLLADSQDLWHQNLPEDMLRMLYRQAF